MSRKREGDWTPATRKKPAKPRPAPVVPTTDAERELEAAQAIEKARVHLAEAEAMAPWGAAPHACTHSAYYTMYFVAVAALFRAGGVGPRRSVPASHEHVLQHYIALAEVQGGALKESGRSLNRARDLRIGADYFGGASADSHSLSAAEAAAVTRDARRMFDDWQAVWSGRTPGVSLEPGKGPPDPPRGQ